MLLPSFLVAQHAWPVYLTIGHIRKDIRCTPRLRTSILVGLIHCPPKCAKIIDEAWPSVVGTLLSQPRHLDIIGPGLKWDCADGIQRQCYPVLAGVSNGSGLPLQIPDWVGTEPLTNLRSPFSIHPNRQFSQCLIEVSLPVRIRRVVSGLSSRSICRIVYCSCFCSWIIVY